MTEPPTNESGAAKQYADECVRYGDTPGSVSDVVNLARAYLSLGAEVDALREALHQIAADSNGSWGQFARNVLEDYPE